VIDERKLKKLRKDAGMTAEKLGFALGVHFSTILHMERGVKQPSLDLYIRIADFFGISLDDLRKKNA